MINGSQIPQSNKGKQSYAHGKVNHTSVETAQENPRVVLGLCLVNSALTSVLFESGASHPFVTSQYVAKHNIPMSIMP
jgi:hypothetical protein